MLKYFSAWCGGVCFGALCLISGAGVYMWVVLAMVSRRIPFALWLAGCVGVGAVISLSVPINAYVVFAVFTLTLMSMREILIRYVYSPHFLVACAMGCATHVVFSLLCWVCSFVLGGGEAVPFSDHLRRETALLVPTGIALIASYKLLNIVLPVANKQVTLEYYVGGRS